MKAQIIPRDKMARYIQFCETKENEPCICGHCGETISGFRTFPYFYDEEENDVYFAEVCPMCGELMISKE